MQELRGVLLESKFTDEAMWEDLRPGHVMTQVSSITFETYEARLRAMMKKDIQSHPSVGKTIKIF